MSRTFVHLQVSSSTEFIPSKRKELHLGKLHSLATYLFLASQMKATGLFDATTKLPISSAALNEYNSEAYRSSYHTCSKAPVVTTAEEQFKNASAEITSFRINLFYFFSKFKTNNELRIHKQDVFPRIFAHMAVEARSRF